MTRCLGWAVAAALALLPLSGGPSSAAVPPPHGGTIVIEPRTGDGEYDPSMPAFVEAASEALTAKGFTILDDSAHAAYAIELTLSRADVGTGLAKDRGGASVGIVGAGVVVPFSTGRSTVVTLQRTRLEFRIHSRGDDSTVWHGAAVTVRSTGTPKGADGTVAGDLSRALLGIYPAVPEDVIGIP